MGGPGSGRKPEDARLGHGSVTHEDPRYLTQTTGRSIPVPVIPEADPKWHPIARSWYNSLKVSGQSQFYQASDWTTAVCAAQIFDRFLRTDNGNVLMQFVRLSERLGATLIDRKRSRIELVDGVIKDDDREEAAGAVIEWQGRLGVVRDSAGPGSGQGS